VQSLGYLTQYNLAVFSETTF